MGKFEEVYAINVNDKTEKKGNLTYLSWGVNDVAKAVKWYEKQLGLPIAEWGADECEAVRNVLKEQQEKRKKAAEKSTPKTEK